MDFESLIKEITNGGPNFKESESILIEISSSEPGTFISNLLAIITQTQDKTLQLSATNMLTIPVKRNNDQVFNRLDPKVIPIQNRMEMKNVLIQLLSYPTDIARVASEVLVFYFENQLELNNQIIQELISLLTPENAANITIHLLKTILNLAMTGFLVPATTYECLNQIFSFATSVETSDEFKKVFISIFLQLISRMLPPTEINDFLFEILQWVWSFTPQAPKEGFEFVKYFMTTKYQLVTQIPDFQQQVFTAIMSENKDMSIGAINLLSQRFYTPIDDKIEAVNFLVDNNQSEIIQSLIEIISNDESPDIVKPESLTAAARISLASMTLNSSDEIRELLISTSCELIESQQIGQRDAAIIIFTNLLNERDEKVASIKPYTTQFVLAAISDQTPRIMILGFYLLQSLSMGSNFQVDDQMISYVVNAVNADIEDLSNEVIECLFVILSKCSEEAKNAAIEAVFHHILEMSDENDKAEYLRYLDAMVPKLSKEVASLSLPTALELAYNSLQAPTIPIFAFPAIGFCSSLFSKSENLAADNYESFLQMGMVLVENEMLTDGALVFTSLLKSINDQNIVDFSVNLIKEKLTSVSNSEELSSMLKLCVAATKYIDDLEFLESILMTSISFANSSDTDENVKSEVLNLILTIFTEKSKDLIFGHIPQVFECVFIVWKYPISIHPTLNAMARECIPFCNEQSPVVQKLVLGVLFQMDNRIMKQEETGSFIVDVCEAVHRCSEDPLADLACLSGKVEYLKKYIQPEIVEKICSMLPPPPQ
ncbi:hypothetical protein TVAG_419610 [Trichomonas vaginalis G3]|uniref:Importin N-terminal domain-containing protein n=1 Tax=Trichomonas vaginalis (strain ATCC PRA-98 / G3) TaxID=412133 RepID=A2EIT5_TRIV3|nr:armadillo (ARM) repeat-containing protein family [Trichomonas vaginalis G3]EAY07419.1 hypothetical protein TVAG_419610 [Trichomonas vaginalis G3]KAI5484629.1 armadillo (ARM) repeat-containing protein family [Trichomonas vaginalis G3]|eukprot:XP_001319642.1 hypothetical protein [Trichomonas vaginalis G3]